MEERALFKILDTGRNFIIITDTIETEIEYGLFALSVCNTDFQIVEQQLSSYIINRTIPFDIGEEVQYLSMLLSSLISSDYLDKKQSLAIKYLFTLEMKNSFENIQHILYSVDEHLPIFFQYKELHQHIKDSLLFKTIAFSSTLQAEINQLHIPSAIFTTKNGYPMTSYYLNNTFSYLIIDLQKYLLSGKCLKECNYCKRLFFPRYRTTEIYCQLKHKDTNKTCYELQQHSKDDEFSQAAKNARAFQHSRCYNESTLSQYDETFLKNLYKAWSKDCGAMTKKYRKENNIKGFEKWFESTKFTSKRLKELYSELPSE